MDEKLAPCIVYDGNDFLIINKPAGLLAHRTGKPETGKSRTLADWLLENYPAVKAVGDDPKTRPGIVHRLDKDTSGLMIVCLTSKTFSYFKNQFKERQIHKTYLALVYGIPKGKQGMIETPLGLKSGTIRRTTHIKNMKMVKEAATKYKVIKSFGAPPVSLLEVQPITGRTHQIRVHLSSIGNPIVGDRLYGKKELPAGVSRLFLHAYSLEFVSPKGEKFKIEADLPDDMDNFMKSAIAIS